jgi:hypothetical protein
MSQSDPWTDYAILQQRANRSKIDARAWAAEEQANQFLIAIANGNLKPHSEGRQTWLDNLYTNRTKKHRRRTRSLLLNQHFWAASEPSVAHNRAVAIEALERIKKSTTAHEWATLIALSNGESYEALAAQHQCSQSALKTRISRCRKQLMLLCEVLCLILIVNPLNVGGVQRLLLVSERPGPITRKVHAWTSSRTALFAEPGMLLA